MTKPTLVEIHVTPQTAAFLRDLAEERGIEFHEAAWHAVRVGGCALALPLGANLLQGATNVAVSLIVKERSEKKS
jgi:hypothetical protein